MKFMHRVVHLGACIQATSTGPPSILAPPTLCSKEECPKNHPEYTKVHGKHTARLKLEHFKNDSVKFAQSLPLAPKMIEMFVLMEQAVAAVSPGSSTLFFKDDGL